MPDAPAWTPVELALPDSDSTVIIGHAEWDEPVWMGYHDGKRWVSVEGVRLDGTGRTDEANYLPPTHWRYLPEPPPDETIDQSAIDWVCHGTFTEHSRDVLNQANRATCEKCLDELEHHERAAVDAGRKPPAYTLRRKRINARLRQLANPKKGGS